MIFTDMDTTNLGNIFFYRCKHIDWKQLIETLEEVGYDGFLEMETFTEKGTEVARGMGIWRQIGKETPLEEAKKGIHFLKKTMKQEV